MFNSLNSSRIQPSAVRRGPSRTDKAQASISSNESQPSSPKIAITPPPAPHHLAPRPSPARPPHSPPTHPVVRRRRRPRPAAPPRRAPRRPSPGGARRGPRLARSAQALPGPQVRGRRPAASPGFGRRAPALPRGPSREARPCARVESSPER
eukprot:824474-Prymnesium_polylepis.1